MRRLNEIVGSITSIFDVVAGAGVVVMALLATANAVTRKTPLGPIPGTFEIAGYLGVVVIGFALARTQWKGGNIAVDFVTSRFPRRMQAAILSVAYFVAMVLYSGVSYATMRYGADLASQGAVSMTLEWPFYPLVYALAVCFALLAIVLLADWLKALREIGRE